MKKILLIILVFFSLSAFAQNPGSDSSGMLYQNASWKFRAKTWFKGNVFITNLVKRSTGTQRILTQNSHTGRIEYIDSSDLRPTVPSLQQVATIGDSSSKSIAVNQYNTATQLTRTSQEYFYKSSTAALQAATMTLSAWVYIDNNTANAVIASKDDDSSTTGSEYLLALLENGASDYFQFQVETTAGTPFVAATSFGTPTINTWIFVAAWYSSTTNRVYIQINNGVIDSAAVTGTLRATSTPFTIGANRSQSGASVGSYWNGRISSVGFWKRVLTAKERSFMYNAGSSVMYRNLYPGIKYNLLSYWDLEGASVTDGTGTNTLTAVNTPTSAVGNTGTAFSTGSSVDIGGTLNVSGNSNFSTATFNTFKILPTYTESTKRLYVPDTVYNLTAWTNNYTVPTKNAINNWITGFYLPLVGGTLTGPLYFNADNTIDIGFSGSSRPRRVYVGTELLGPTLSGSESASGTLTLKSTTSGTKGKILFGSSAYDETNNTLGIGTASPGTGAINIQKSNNDGGATPAPSINVTNTNVTAATGADYNIANLNLQAGNGTVLSQLVSVYGTSPAPFDLGSGLQIITRTNHPIMFSVNNVQAGVISTAGNFGFGVASPTAYGHFKAGTASANTAPLKFTKGPVNTVMEQGTVEYDSSHYMTNNAINRFALGGKIKDFVSQVNNSGTSETDLYTYTTKANTLASTGEDLVFNVSLALNDGTATSTLKVYFAGNAIATTSALAITGPVSVTARIKRINATDVETTTTFSLSDGSVYVENQTVTALTFTGTNIIKITGQAGGGSGGSNDITAKSGDVFWHGAANN